jgi:PcfJ-like protein
MDHCVGSYFAQCRAGHTHILSLAENGERAVTVEIHLALNHRKPNLTVAQFKGYRNEVPADPALHGAMRRFLADLRSGRHPLNLPELARYRGQEATAIDTEREELGLDHARDIYPYYLPLLPRGSPDRFDIWIERSGLAAGLTAAIEAALLNSNLTTTEDSDEPV